MKSIFDQCMICQFFDECKRSIIKNHYDVEYNIYDKEQQDLINSGNRHTPDNVNEDSQRR